MTTGIYSITHRKSKKKYIGQSRDIEKRWYSHRNDLKNGKHSNKELQKDYDDCDAEPYLFDIICTIDDVESYNDDELNDLLNILERKYMEEARKINGIYNVNAIPPLCNYKNIPRELFHSLSKSILVEIINELLDEKDGVILNNINSSDKEKIVELEKELWINKKLLEIEKNNLEIWKEEAINLYVDNTKLYKDIGRLLS